MTIQVETKDCTALTDAELGDMGDICAGRFEFGTLSKAREDWVLITLVRIDDRLHGFSFSTLERIGGTPCVLLGLVSVKRNAKRDAVLKALMAEEYHRALMAFPDEDVLLGTRFASASGFEAFRALTEVVPRPDHRAVGEERAWGRRLAKRFSVEGEYDGQTFLVKGDGSPAPVFDHESSKPEKLDPELVALFEGTNPDKGDCLIACGWAMAEDLLKLGAR